MFYIDTSGKGVRYLLGDEHAPEHFNTKIWSRWIPGARHQAYMVERVGPGEEKGGARRPHNIHVRVHIYLQLS